MEVYNSTTGPRTVRITGKGAGNDTGKEERLISERNGGVNRELNSTLQWPV